VQAASKIKQSESSQIAIDRFFNYLTLSLIEKIFWDIKGYAPMAVELAEPVGRTINQYFPGCHRCLENVDA
jgi:hypothetical protein